MRNCILLYALGHNKSSKTGAKIETNGQKSKKIAKASKNNQDDVGVANQEYGGNHKKTKKLVTDHTHVGLTDDFLKDAEGTGKKMKSELGVGKGNVRNNGDLHPPKKSKLSDDTAKKSQTYRKNEEVGKSTLDLKAKNRLPLKGQTNGSDSGVLGDEDFLLPTKRRRLVLEDMSSPTSMSENRTAESSITPKKGLDNDSVKSGTQVHMKRRAVRICDDDEDEPKTPVHGRSSKVVDKVLHTSMSVEGVAVVTEAIQDSPSLRKSVHVKESVSSSQQDVTVVEGKVCHTPAKSEPESKSSDETLKKFVSPIKSPIDAYNQMGEPSKVNKSLGKVSGNVPQKKGQSGSSKAAIGIHDSGHHSKNNAVNEKSRTVFSVEKQKVTSKTTPKSSSRVNDSAAVLRKPNDSNFLSSYSSERCARICFCCSS